MQTLQKGCFGLGVDDEVSKTWRQVEKRAIQMAGGVSCSIIPNLDIDHVLKYLDLAQAADKKAAEQYDTIRTIFNDTLQCI